MLPETGSPPPPEEVPYQGRAIRMGQPFILVTPAGYKKRVELVRPLYVKEIIQATLGHSHDAATAKLGQMSLDGTDLLIHSDTLVDFNRECLTLSLAGLPGGSPEAAIRAKILQILSDKNVPEEVAKTKVDDALRLCGKQLEGWLGNPTWQNLKAVVGTKVTFVDRKKGKEGPDPWLLDDPWKKAASSSREPNSTGGNPKLKQTAQSEITPIPEAWQNEDGTCPSLLSKLQVGNCGLVLMTKSQLEAWVDTATPLSVDELSVIIFPPLATTDPLPASWGTPEVVEFPARVSNPQGANLPRIEDTTALLRGSLIHLGTKKITLAGRNTLVDFPEHDSVSMIVEIYQKDMGQTQWETAIKDLPTYVSHTLSPATLQSNWGTRYFGPDGKVTEKSKSVKAALNILVTSSEVQPILRLSGPLLWVSPRVGQKEFARYKPIWLNETSLHAAQVQHDKISKAYGLVRSRRDLGIRVLISDFEQLRKVVHPTKAFMPALGPTEDVTLYKLSPTPIGATAEDVSNFLTTQAKLSGVARKQLNAKAWLVAVVGKAPSYLQTKAGFVIFQQWKQWRTPSTVQEATVVGPRSLQWAQPAGSVPKPQSTLPPQVQGNRPDPQGPVQNLLDAKVKESEDRILKSVEEKLLQATQANQTEVLQVKDQLAKQENNLEQMQASQTEMAAAQSEIQADIMQLQEESQRHQSTLQASISKLEASAQSQTETMTTKFEQVLAEIGRLSSIKRTPSHSRDPSPEKQPKHS